MDTKMETNKNPLSEKVEQVSDEEEDYMPDALPVRKTSAPSVKVRQSFIQNMRTSLTSLDGMRRENTRGRRMGTAAFFVVLVLCAVMIVTNMLAIELLKDMKIDSNTLVDKSTGERIHVQNMQHEIPFPRSAATELNAKTFHGINIVQVTEGDGRQDATYQIVAHQVRNCPEAYPHYCHEDGLAYLAFTNLPGVVLYGTTDTIGPDGTRSGTASEGIGKQITFYYIREKEFIADMTTEAPQLPTVEDIKRHLLSTVEFRPVTLPISGDEHHSRHLSQSLSWTDNGNAAKNRGAQPGCDQDWTGTEEEAKTRCAADDSCVYIHDNNCSGSHWRTCSTIVLEANGAACLMTAIRMGFSGATSGGWGWGR